MSQTASDSNDPNSATPAPPPQEFDLLAFWIQHQRLIIRLVVVALLAVAVWGAILFMDYRRRAGSEEALANAKTADDYRKVTSDWSGTPAAGTAEIRLAEELRKEGKPAEAAQALREFLDKYPVHPMRTAAAHAFAASLETAGKLDEALTAYQKFGSEHGRSAFAPLAYIGQARVLIAQNKPDKAREILETVEQKFTGNPFLDDARTLLDDIKNAAGRKTGGSPRPMPAPTPAPALNLQGAIPPPVPPGTPMPVPPMSITPTVPAASASPEIPPTPVTTTTPAIPPMPVTPAGTIPPAVPVTPAIPPASAAAAPLAPAVPTIPAAPPTPPK
jgi:predicted negative regulator of RcsB-dependent stress response